VFAPFSGGGNDEALTEAAFSIRRLKAPAGGGEKGVDVGFLERVRRVIEFALNGPIIAAAVFLGHQVDTDVRPPTIRPLWP